MLWSHLLTSLHQGRALLTIATGNMSDSDADRAGLVPSHAYALLDMRQVKSERLVKLKNPWSHLRWKGNYSPNDTIVSEECGVEVGPSITELSLSLSLSLSSIELDW